MTSVLFLKKGCIFILVNSRLSLFMQIFALAHELYHIIGFISGEDDAFESVLKSSVIDESAAKLEDSEANAFAALFLVPREFLLQQADIYGIRRGRIVLKDVLKLMDNFAVPYKAMVLRLYEEDFIDRKKADELLNVDNSVIEEEIRLTGISTRWQSSQRRRHY